MATATEELALPVIGDLALPYMGELVLPVIRDLALPYMGELALPVIGDLALPYMGELALMALALSEPVSMALALEKLVPPLTMGSDVPLAPYWSDFDSPSISDEHRLPATKIGMIINNDIIEK
ncbi:hypothetical protein STEG23_037733 [Scotinomys teguina]